MYTTLGSTSSFKIVVFICSFTKDQGDPVSYISMDKEEDVYVRMQKDDGSYYYVQKKGGHELYVDVKGKKYINYNDKETEDEEYYVKMQKEGGGYRYVPMKAGVAQKHNQEELNEEGIYANLSSSGTVDQEIYEDMNRDGNPANFSPGDIVQGDQELYEDMNRDGNQTTLSPGDPGHVEQLYEDMNQENREELYTDMQPAGGEEGSSPLYITMAEGLVTNFFFKINIYILLHSCHFIITSMSILKCHL